MNTYHQLIEWLEDLEDEAWARNYAARKAAGQLTSDELETIPLEQVAAELEAHWTARTLTESDVPR